MSFRWYFNTSLWSPTSPELVKISSYIQPEEKHRIARFYFIRDAKSSLIGRLLIRKLIHLCTGTPNHLITLERDPSNKPILVSPSNKQLNFNVSHQGSYVVLASDNSASTIGIDVMNIEKPGKISKTADEYFRLMNRQFTENEWSQIKGRDLSDSQKMINFTRFWCLKEAYVKAIGVGIVIDLKTVDFQTHSELVPGGPVVTDTEIAVDGSKETWWHFEERFLDPSHIVTVGKQTPLNPSVHPAPEFQEIRLFQLLEDMSVLQEEDVEWAETILKKK